MTAEALVSAEPDTEILSAVQSIGDVCCLLQLATGTLVNWVAWEALDLAGRVIGAFHYTAATKPATAFELVPPGEIESFMTETLPNLCTLDSRWRFREAVLSLIDAKLEGDFLEARGLKAATLVDFLCGRFREVEGKERVLSEDDFNRWSKQVKPKVAELSVQKLRESGIILPENACAASVVDDMMAHWNEFNRYSFRRSLRWLLEELRLEVPRNEIDKGVDSRNALVHDQRFVSGETTEMFTEYVRLLSLADRILLALVGYRGFYNDWTRWGGVRQTLRTRMQYSPQPRG